MTMTVGIDLSLSCTAIVVVESSTGEVKHQQTKIGYSLPLGAPWWDRIQRIKTITKQLDATLSCLPSCDMTVFEGPSLGSRGAQMFMIGEMMGRFEEQLESWEIPEVVEVAPANLKKFATGKGNAKKPLISAHVQKRWGQIFADDNLTDAFVLCQIGRALQGHLTGMPQQHMTALDKVLRHVKDA